MSSELKARIQADLNSARKARHKQRILVLGTVLSEIRNKEIDGRVDVDDEGVIQVLTKAIKQRRDASAQFREAGRDDLATTEDSQVRVLEVYLPAALSEDEVRAFVRELVAGGATQMGAIMGGLMPRIRGRFDGKEANRVVRDVLGEL